MEMVVNEAEEEVLGLPLQKLFRRSSRLTNPYDPRAVTILQDGELEVSPPKSSWNCFKS